MIVTPTYKREHLQEGGAPPVATGILRFPDTSSSHLSVPCKHPGTYTEHACVSNHYSPWSFKL